MAYPTSSRPTDLQVANQSFPSFRDDLNRILEHFTQFHAGTSRPLYINHGMMWLDTTDSANPILKFYDGSDDITFATFNTSANTVNVSDSSTSLSGDTSPQLGGNLDVVTHSIVSTSNRDINITPNGTGRTVFGTATQPKTFVNTFASVSGSFNFDTHQNFIVTLGNSANALANPTTETSNVGQTGVFIFIQPSSGSAGTISLIGDYETVGGGSLDLSSTNGAYDVVPYIIKTENSILLGTPQLAFS
tara:strand:+ start:22 stop:762 length:741 start_codon:yes stop_codon:yes gene_type:complete